MKNLFVVLLCGICLCGCASGRKYIITTVAGNGEYGFSGDGGHALSARLRLPTYILADKSGGIIFADPSNYRIRKVDSRGVITTIAGNGTAGTAGDGGPAVDAQFDHPRSIAADKAGNIYIADKTARRVRKIGSDGVITAFAGNGGNGCTGDGGPAVSAEIGEVSSIALDGAGNMYIADASNNVIRRVDAENKITTVAGNGVEDYGGDGGPALEASLHLGYGGDVIADRAGNLFIADRYNNRVRKVDSGGLMTTYAGNGRQGYSGDGGPAISAMLNHPTALALDKKGNLYIADLEGHRVRMVAPSGVITTVAGNGMPGFNSDNIDATEAMLNWPTALAIDKSGNIYIGDAYNNRVRKLIKK